MFLVEFICHQKCTLWRKLHFSACCTNDIFVDIFQNMVNIYYFGLFWKSPLLFLVLLCCITRKSSAKNGFCCVSNKNYCKTRKRPRSSAIRLPVSEHNFPTCSLIEFTGLRCFHNENRNFLVHRLKLPESF